MTAGCRQTLHFIPSSSRDDGADLDHVVVGEGGVARHELAALDDEHRLAVDVEALQESDDRRRTGDLDLTGRVAQLDDHAGGNAALVIPVSRISIVSPAFSVIVSTTSSSRVTRALRKRATPRVAHTASQARLLPSTPRR